MILSEKYCIQRPLGKGGEGSVWLAVHQKTEQLWAVKEITAYGGQQAFHELNMMKKLQHPSLPRIIDVLEEDGCVYLIMEYIRGIPLDLFLKKQGHMEPEQVIDIGLQLSAALRYLHERATPVFHLDIKPSNIIRKKNGRIILADFGAAWKENGRSIQDGVVGAGGVAQHRTMENEGCTVQRRTMGNEGCTAQRKVSGNEGRTEQRRALGTDGYAAPEQYDLKRPVDARTDIYGLGATLYHLISGVRYSKALQKSRIPGCPDYLAGIIKKCVAQQPEFRYENCRQLQKALQRAAKKQDNRKRRYQLWIAVFLAVFAAGIAVRELSEELKVQGEETWNYEKLLTEAECLGITERRTLYEKAVFLAPQRKEAYLQWLKDADGDACFDQEEEQYIRTLLHTIPLGQEKTYEEMLEENPENYGIVTCRLGTICWYDYEGTEGRYIAAGWFAKAKRAADKVLSEANASAAELVEEMTEELTEKTTEKTQEKLSEKVIEKTQAELAEEPTEEATEEPSEKTSEKTPEKTQEKTQEKTAEETTEKAAEKTAEEMVEERDVPEMERISAEESADIVQEKTEADWMVRARVYAHISGYYDRLGRQDLSGEQENTALEYWNDLDCIWEKNIGAYDNPVTELRFWEETVNQIIFLAEDFQKAGISKECMLDRIDQISQKAGASEEKQGELEKQLRLTILKQTETAKDIVKRLTDKP